MQVRYIRREIQDELLRLAGHYPVVMVTGPRQSGKTTLCRNAFQSFHYVNLEDVTLREQISVSAKAFLLRYAGGLIIDEVQQLPELFSYIQVVVDEVPGCHFVLTGSSSLALMERVTQSLAGRSASLTLLPLSLKELGEKASGDTNALLMNGGYPAVWAKGIPVQDLSRQYYNTYIERDVRQLLKVKDLTKFQVFIRLCSGRIATELNASALSNEVGVSVKTVIEWVSVLEASYILCRLPPFYKNIGKRLIKTPKLYFYDTGLACFLLGIDNPEQLATHPLRGAIFENYVLLEFMKHRFNAGKLPNLYFYRDKSEREVDIIQEFGDAIAAYEVKSATSFHKDFLKNLAYLEALLGDGIVSTQVVYDGEQDIDCDRFGMVNFRNLRFR